MREHFDLTPGGLIKMLDFKRPIYQQTAAYGYFGRELPDFTWEKIDKADVLQKALQDHFRRLRATSCPSLWYYFSRFYVVGHLLIILGDHVEIFYNPNRTHTNNGMLSLVGFEIKQQKTNTTDV